MNKKEKVEAILQIFLLVTATIAFSYIVGEVFGNKIEIVSAQEENAEDSEEISDEVLDALKDGLPNYEDCGQECDETLRQGLLDLERLGYLNREDFSDPEAVYSALNQYKTNTANSINSGDAGEVDSSTLLDNWLPEPPSISGGDIQRSLADSTGGLYYCPETNDGRICQPFAGNVCNENCKVDCINIDLLVGELPIDSVCKLGTCYDNNEGICLPRSPRGACESSNLDWFEAGNSQAENLCRNGCCIIRGQGFFVNENQCRNKALGHGVELGTEDTYFNSYLTEEQECIAEANRLKNENIEGACTFSNEDDEKDCKFVTGSECGEIGGVFNKDKLCSNAELNTVCTKQNSTNCVEGFDEIYWFDSCGNKENIYEGSSQTEKDSSWNTGLIKPKNESCIVGSSGDKLANQGTCGNCDRFKGTICSEKMEEPIVQKLDDENQNYVCLDMGCYDDKGKRIREHGESWCAYQGKIGLDGSLGEDSPLNEVLGIGIPQVTGPFGILIGGNRAVDTVGSTHFRVSCLNGRIDTDPCDIYRNAICVEERSEIEGSEREFSQAACRPNRAMECFQYNPGVSEGRLIGHVGGLAGPQGAWRILKAKLDLTCGLDPDCFVKDVNLASGSDDTFKFAYCAPRYKPGFDLSNPESGSQICAQASQSCTAVFVKERTGPGQIQWVCKANCDCVDWNKVDPGSAKPSQEFVRQMGDFCTSLGDCGYSVNYAGDLPGGKGYRISKGDQNKPMARLRGILDGGALGDFSDLFDPVNLLKLGDGTPMPNEYIPANKTLIGGLNRFLDEQGIGDTLDEIDALIGEFSAGLGGGGGDYGVPDVSSGHTDGLKSVGLVAGGVGTAALGASYLAGGVTSAGSIAVASTSAYTYTAAQVAGFSSVLLGAGIGAATVGFLIDVLGLGPGLSAGFTYALIGAGAVSGAIIVGQTLGAFTGALATNPIGWIILIVIILVLIFLKIMGVGEVEEVKVNFECKQWVPPKGVSAETCRSCGNDKLSDGQESFPCNKYSCMALGGACVFVEGSEIPGRGGICEYSPDDDTNSPIITSLRDENVLTTGFEYEDVDLEGERTFTIEKTEGECVDQFESVRFGFEINEYATKCAISGSPRESIEQMVNIGAGKNFSFTFSTLNADALGIEDLDEEERNDIKLYIVCEDLKENSNIGNEYAANLCVIPRDLTATNILNREELEEIYIPNNAEAAEIDILINEPAECKWSTDEFKSFEEMENTTECNNFLQCSATIPLPENEEQICIKCRDHPEWKGTDRESDRNENSQCVTSSITRTDELQITSISPDNKHITRGSQDTSIELQVTTEGGKDGTADCYWDLDNYGENPFFETGNRNVHTQLLGGGSAVLEEGNHELKVRCVDGVGNQATRETRFTLDVDTNYPRITRIYAESGNLKIITDEVAECAFVNEKPEGTGICGFSVENCDDIEECETMWIDSTGDFFAEHSTQFEEDKTYHIKCADSFGNQPGQCSAIVRQGASFEIIGYRESL